MVEFVPDSVIATCFATPEGHDIVDCFGILALFVLPNTILLQDPLPFFWKTLEDISG